MQGKIDAALEYFEKAISIDDRCEFAYETLGTVEVQRGNLEHAIELFEKALTFAKSELEMVHLFSLKNAAVAQFNVSFQHIFVEILWGVRFEFGVFFDTMGIDLGLKVRERESDEILD